MYTWSVQIIKTLNTYIYLRMKSCLILSPSSSQIRAEAQCVDLTRAWLVPTDWIQLRRAGGRWDSQEALPGLPVFQPRVLVKYFDVDLSRPIIRFDTDMINITNDIIINLSPASSPGQLWCWTQGVWCQGRGEKSARWAMEIYAVLMMTSFHHGKTKRGQLTKNKAK